MGDCHPSKGSAIPLIEINTIKRVSAAIKLVSKESNANPNVTNKAREGN